MKKSMFKKIAVAGLMAMGIMGCGVSTGMAQSRDITIDGDHGKLAPDTRGI